MLMKTVTMKPTHSGVKTVFSGVTWAMKFMCNSMWHYNNPFVFRGSEMKDLENPGRACGISLALFVQ